MSFACGADRAGLCCVCSAAELAFTAVTTPAGLDLSVFDSPAPAIFPIQERKRGVGPDDLRIEEDRLRKLVAESMAHRYAACATTRSDCVQ